MKNKNQITKSIALISMFLSILIICSWITIPFTIPFTLQTLAIFCIILLTNIRVSLVIIILYILLGMLGFPVFGSFQGGIGIILGPTGGFIIGFIPMIITSSILKYIIKEKKFYFISLFIGLIVCYTFGSIWYYYLYKLKSNFYDVLLVSVLPFIIPDIIKILISILIVNRINKKD